MSIFHHHNLIVAFGVLGNIVSIFVYFAPLPTFIQIWKKKSTLGFESLPYTVALFSAMLWLYYAFLKGNAMLLISINLFGCVVETVYIIVFLVFASRETRKRTWKVLGLLNVGVLSVIVGLTYVLFKGEIRVQVVGWACVVVSVTVFAAPLTILFQVVRTKSVEFMPFTLSCFLTLSAVMWFFYGLLLGDLCVALPNVFGFILGVVQMLLYQIYRGSSNNNNNNDIVKDNKPQSEHVIINIVALTTSEVQPVASNGGDAITTYSDRDSDRDESREGETNDNEHMDDNEKIVASDAPQINVCNMHDPPMTNAV